MTETYEYIPRLKVTIWRKNGVIHRDDDEPAIVYDDGTKLWRKNGIIHRDGDNPAAIYSDGRKLWYKKGRCYKESGPVKDDKNHSATDQLYEIRCLDNFRHNLDGPAIVYSQKNTGEIIHKAYYVYGVELSEMQYKLFIDVFTTGKIYKKYQKYKKYKKIRQQQHKALTLLENLQNDTGDNKDYYSIPKVLVNDITHIKN